MVNKMCDFITIPRSIFRDEALGDSRYSRREAFLYLVQKAVYQTQTVTVKGGRVELKRGQLCASVRFLADTWGWSKDKVSRTLSDFVSERRIDIFKDTLTSIISIVNYDLYQPSSDTYKDTDKDGDKDKYNKDNKDNKEKKDNKKKTTYSAEVEELYAMYPAKCPMRNTETARRPFCKDIIERLLKKRSFDDLKRNMKKYLEDNYGKHYLQNFSTFLHQFPNYDEEPGLLFQEKKWKVKGERYNRDEVFKLVKDQNEFIAIPPEIRMALRDGKDIIWDGDKFVIAGPEE